MSDCELRAELERVTSENVQLRQALALAEAEREYLRHAILALEPVTPWSAAEWRASIADARPIEPLLEELSLGNIS